MEIGNFFTIRDKYFDHVRSNLRGINYKTKSEFFEMVKDDIYKNFVYAPQVSDVGRKNLEEMVRLQLSSKKKQIDNSIKDAEEQIELTKRAKSDVETHSKRQEYIKRKTKNIEYLSEKYTPKFVKPHYMKLSGDAVEKLVLGEEVIFHLHFFYGRHFVRQSDLSSYGCTLEEMYGTWFLTLLPVHTSAEVIQTENKNPVITL